MGGAVVDVAGEEDDVAGALGLDPRQQARELQLTAQGRAVLGVGDRLLALAVGHHDPQRQVREDHLPGRLRPAQTLQQPLQLLLAEHRRGALLPPVGVLALVSAHVEHEHVQRRPAGDLPVDALRLEAGAGLQRADVGDRLVLLPGASAPGGEGVHVDDGVAVVLQHLAGPPVVGGLVVVPGGDDRDLGVQRADVLVPQVVAVAAAELPQCLGDLRDLVGDQVAPDRAVGLLDALLDRAVGVDRVPGVEEEVRLHGAHRLVAEHAADVGVDAVPLAGGVGRPDEGLRPVGAVPGRGPEAADADLAPLPVLVLEEQLDLELRVGGEVRRADPGGEVGPLGGPGAAQHDRLAVLAAALPPAPRGGGEATALTVQGVQDGVEPALARGAGPEHGGVHGDVPGLQAGGQGQASGAGAGRSGTSGRGGGGGRGDGGDRGGEGGRGGALEEGATGGGAEGVHVGSELLRGDEGVARR